MTFYLVEGVLFIALLVTSVSVLQMYREIRRLRNDQAAFLGAIEDTNRTFDGLKGTLLEISRDGLQVAQRLEARLAEGRTLIEQLEMARRGWTGPSGEAPATKVAS
jgi:hypothetical protein